MFVTAQTSRASQGHERAAPAEVKNVAGPAKPSIPAALPTAIMPTATLVHAVTNKAGPAKPSILAVIIPTAAPVRDGTKRQGQPIRQCRQPRLRPSRPLPRSLVMAAKAKPSIPTAARAAITHTAVLVRRERGRAQAAATGSVAAAVGVSSSAFSGAPPAAAPRRWCLAGTARFPP